MSKKVVKSDGRLREGPSVASPKPPGRVDKMAEAVQECTYALTLLAKSLDDGPLRTACIESAARAQAYAQSATFKSQYGRRGLRRNDKRAMALQARNGHPDDESADKPE